MNEKEIAELRRRIAPEKHNFTILRGRYINEKRETISEFSTPFFLLPEEESEKYLAIFRRALSGTVGRNLIDIGFSMGQVESGEEHGRLMMLRQSALKEEEAVKAFFDAAAAGVDIEGNALILLAADSYDVPIKHRDEGGMGESDSMFRYIVCAVCPVKEAKSTLTYDAAKKEFHAVSCNWNVGAPELGFLFPAFDGRRANIYNALYYVKNAADSHESFSDAVFKVEPPLPAAEQKQIFESILGDTLGDECSYEVVQAIHDDIAQKIDDHKATRDPEPLVVSKNDVKSVLASCGVSDEKITDFAKRFDEEYGGMDMPPRNLVEPKQFEVKTPDVTVKVNPDRGDLIETRVIDGVKYVLIRADEDITVNGVAINIARDDMAKDE
ncbi:MAG: DUF4317 domain-containing protein [Clostridia bacterium]|nr:DUF4317 domain-containing protein [Clostridia bacterium]